MPSEKYVARRGSREDGIRMITACCARAPQRCTSRTYMHFLLMFQEVRLIRKTRNQITLCQPAQVVQTPDVWAGQAGPLTAAGALCGLNCALIPFTNSG